VEALRDTPPTEKAVGEIASALSDLGEYFQDDVPEDEAWAKTLVEYYSPDPWESHTVREWWRGFRKQYYVLELLGPAAPFPTWEEWRCDPQ
jgi:hypothetical protein